MKELLELRLAVLNDAEREAKVEAYRSSPTEADPLDVALWADRYGLSLAHIPCAESAEALMYKRLEANINDPITREAFSYVGKVHLFSTEDDECALCDGALVLYPDTDE